MAPETVLIGYFSKQFTAATGGIHAPAYAGVEEICSISECFAKPPPDWVDKWVHNTETWLFDTPEAAWSVVPPAELERYRLYAYRLLPTLFLESGEEAEHPLPELTAVPLSDGFSRLGYDAVVRDPGGRLSEGWPMVPKFGCSRLSCNYMAAEYEVNRYCLVDDLDAAITMARDFATGNCEPGAYCVVEIWRRGCRKRSPSSSDSGSSASTHSGRGPGDGADLLREPARHADARQRGDPTCRRDRRL